MPPLEAKVDRLLDILQENKDGLLTNIAKLTTQLMDFSTAMGAGSSKFAQFYKSSCLSDFDLYLIPETESEPSDGSLPPLHLGPTPVHGLLLAAESTHFRVKIKGPFGVPVAEVDGRKRLFLQLDPSQWDTMLDHLLYHMYHGSLPHKVRAGQLMQLMQLADRLDVPRCLEECNKRFKQIKAKQITLDHVLAFYSLPAGLHESRSLQAAAEVMRKKLISEFEELEEAWADEEHSASFLQLPLAAVEELAACDELQVVSENTVATALASWVAYDAENRAQHGAALLKHIRLQHLTQAYVADVLTQLPGIGEAVSLQDVIKALQYNRATESARAAVVKAPGERAKLDSAAATLKFDWLVNLADILELVEGQLGPGGAGGTLRSDPQWYNGFRLELVIEVGPAGQEGTAGAAAASSSPAAAGGKLDGSSGLLSKGSEEPCREAAGQAQLRMFVSVGVDLGLGEDDVLPVPSADVEGIVCMPSFKSCIRNVFPVKAESRHASADGEVGVWFKTIALGPEGAHDEASLAAGIARYDPVVPTVSWPATAVQLEGLQELYVSCELARCG